MLPQISCQPEKRAGSGLPKLIRAGEGTSPAPQYATLRESALALRWVSSQYGLPAGVSVTQRDGLMGLKSSGR
jgi:hypothetical protein